MHVGSHPVRVVMADTPRSQFWGLMFRIAIWDDQGMLFVYPHPRKVCMWMRNTFIPLSVAFVRENGVIAGPDDIQPLTRRLQRAPQPVRYVLEVPRGWFELNDVAVGDRITAIAPIQRANPAAP